MDNPPVDAPNPDALSVGFSKEDRELLVQTYLRMGYLVEKVRASNGHGNSKLERLAWAALGASGIAGMMATASFIAWVIVR